MSRHRIFGILLFGLLVSLLISGCGGGGGGGSSLAAVTVYLYNGGDPITGETVYLMASSSDMAVRQGVTGSDGKAYFSGISPGQNYYAKYTDGLESLPQTVPVAGCEFQIDATMPPSLPDQQ